LVGNKMLSAGVVRQVLGQQFGEKLLHLLHARVHFAVRLK
jgi:hypothetical protein